MPIGNAAWGDIVADTAGHRIGTAKAVRHEGAENLGAIGSLGNTHDINSVRIDIPL